ncbi:MAG: SWF/SNF helicase family protein [Deltaproteobacteria bacterium]|nr:SWF/SNF helicase family protein [Deltaproteobacteria bacterium]
MIRRKKEGVLKQLPARTDKHFFVPMTKEQRLIHDENYDIVVRLVAKWRRFRFLSEADQLKMQIALSMMRMAADNTYLVDKKTVHGPKIEELAALLQDLILDGGEKAVIFSQWLRMTELVEGVLKDLGIAYVHLNGSVPSRQRKSLMVQFREDLACKVFLSKDAGGVGLNLQSGSVVIHMDIPWNPAVLEQRIGHVHRIGQRRLVQVINFVTSASIEERILDLLKFKRSLFAGALDEGGQDIVMIGESQMQKFMQTVEAVTENLEKPDPQMDAQEQIEFAQDTESVDRQEAEEGTEENRPAAAAAGVAADTTAVPLSQLLMKGAEFLAHRGQALAESDGKTSPREAVERQMQDLIGRDDTTGRTYLKIPIPEPETIQGIVSAVGGLLAQVFAKK